MAKLSKLKEQIVSVALDFGNEDIVNVQIKPHAFSWREAKELQREIKSSEDDDHTIALVHRQFLRSVVGWDIEGDTEGVSVPLTPEGLEEVPLTLLGDLLSRSYEQVYAGKKRATS